MQFGYKKLPFEIERKNFATVLSLITSEQWEKCWLTFLGFLLVFLGGSIWHLIIFAMHTYKRMLKKIQNTSFYLIFHLLRVIWQLQAKLEIFHKKVSEQGTLKSLKDH